MSNYVHNYLFCNKDAKKRILSLSDDELYMLKGYYDDIVITIKDNRFLIIFDTWGMEYRTEFITGFIREFKSTKWYCIEENEIEQRCYFWNGSDVECSMRKLIETLDGEEICIRYSDSKFRPLYIIFISAHRIVFENLLKNKMKEYYFSKKSSILIEDYVYSLLIETPGEYIEPLVPFKDGIERTVSIRWRGKFYYIETLEERDDLKKNFIYGEYIFDNMILFFNSILCNEGIEELVSFNLQDET